MEVLADFGDWVDLRVRKFWLSFENPL